jgi:putative oxygen-independent coproporphyrinogen III oxidase
MSAPPLALYVHFPWCVSKCPYCDFNSHALRGALPEADYLQSLIEDLDRQLDPEGPLLGGPSPGGPSHGVALAGRPVVSVFMGGGTPSLFSPDAIGRLLEALRRRLPFAPDAEVTLEANPGTIERGRFAGYAAAGVTRVSLGAQSFDAARLATLGRIHSPGDTRAAAAELHAAGLDNFNLDLMYALPGQDVGGALTDLREALALAPAHISHYHLTMEPGTPFAARPPPDLPADEEAERILEACNGEMLQAGYHLYEISAYARPGRECRHNRVYWTFGDYLGLGAGAHGKLTLPGTPLLIRRSVQPRDPRRYAAGVRPGGERGGLAVTDVPPEQRPFEFMLNALRLIEGSDRSTFESRTGLDWNVVAAEVTALAARGLLELEPAAGRFRTSDRGLRFLNDVLVEFLPSGTGT